MLGRIAGVESRSKVRLIKGSHIVVPRLYEGEQAYILQNRDRRIVFVIPYEGRFTLIGTTDEPFAGDPSQVAISESERDYLLEVVNAHFKRAIAATDVIWSYAGVRPLHDDAALEAAAVTRDYSFDVDAGARGAPLLSVFGGKITTYRRLAEHALEKLAPHFPQMGRAWTAAATLPGGALPEADFDRFLAAFRQRWPFLAPALASRLAHAYGSEADTLLGPARSMADLGRDFGQGLSERELEFLVRHEFAVTAEDVLWRRSKLGLHLPPAASVAIDQWLGALARNARGGEAA
jgi:glycerol-3-phosphate dehydrogenase